MATIEIIEDEHGEGKPRFSAEISAMDDGALVAQDLTQQGAIHAIAFLLKEGCTESNAANMLASLRANASLIRDEAHRRGRPSLFINDQTGFN